MATDTQTVTAAALKRWYTEEWCPECGKWANVKPGCLADTKPGLWERLPAAKPEGLEWIVDRWGTPYVISDDVAASFCVMGVVRTRLNTGMELVRFVTDVMEIMVLQQVCFEEATAIALHKWCDARDKTA